jgi:hypothetical protein
MTRPRGFMAGWEPRASSLALIEHVNAVLDDYAAQVPLTVRQIFYRLVGAYGYEKTEQAYKRLGELLNKARRARLIDMDVIRDDGFTSEGGGGFDASTTSWSWSRIGRRIWVSIARRARLAGWSCGARPRAWCRSWAPLRAPLGSRCAAPGASTA